MNEITLKANAKINLSLDVVGKFDDGYHSLKTIMLEIPLFDIVTVEKTPSEIALSSSLSRLPLGEKNTARRAAVKFFEMAGLSGGARIHIEKNIPVGSGLGGGSADAAAVLSGLNKVYGEPLSKTALLAAALEIGADVPFCLTGGACLATGRGEELTPLAPMPPAFIVLAKPNFSVSTRRVFQGLSLEQIKTRPDTRGMLKALENGDLVGISVRLYNVLEGVTAKMHQEIEQYKDIFLDSGAIGSVMSGSGPSVFGIFKNGAPAKKAGEKLSEITSEVFVLKV